MRVGIADHFGWAVAVTVDRGPEVVDRRRLELVEPDVCPAPIHYEGARLGPDGTAALLAEVRASVARATAAALDELAADLPRPIRSVSLRTWPDDFPQDLETQLRPPYEARADAIMYRRICAELVEQRGWAVHRYEARQVPVQAAAILGDRAAEVLDGVRARLGPPWTKDHRTALAAAICAGGTRPSDGDDPGRRVGGR